MVEFDRAGNGGDKTATRGVDVVAVACDEEIGTRPASSPLIAPDSTG